MSHELIINIPAPKEMYNQQTNEFILIQPAVLHFEHSLYTMSMWESKWKKAFISPNPVADNKTQEETLDYIRMMCKESIDDDMFTYLTTDPIITNKIKKYVDDPMTATVVKDNHTANTTGEIPTSEVLYYDMIALQIPFECQHWHLNRLLTLIKVCSEKNKPPKKMSQADTMRRNASLNAQRRAKFNSKG